MGEGIASSTGRKVVAMNHLAPEEEIARSMVDTASFVLWNKACRHKIASKPITNVDKNKLLKQPVQRQTTWDWVFYKVKLRK